MIHDVLGLARHIQSATAARLDTAFGRTGSASTAPETAPEETVLGRSPQVTSGDAARPQDARDPRDPRDARDGDDDAREEVRRLLEDREEELTLELRLQQSRLEDDPTRAIARLESLRRDARTDGDHTVAGYQIAAEASRELEAARRELAREGGDDERDAPRGEVLAAGADSDRDRADDAPARGVRTDHDQPAPIGSGHAQGA